MLLNVAGNRVQVLGAFVTGEGAPRGEGGAGGLRGEIDAFFAAVANRRDFLARRRVGAVEVRLGFHPLVVDEQVKFALVRIEPRARGVCRFRRSSVSHGLE